MSNRATRLRGRSSSAFDVPARLDRPAERAQLRGQRLADPAGAALRERPAVVVRAAEHDHRGRAGDRLVEAQDGVRGHAGEDRPGRVVAEPPREPRCGLEGVEPEPGEPGGAPRAERDVERRQDVGDQVAEAADERTDEPPIRVAVPAELVRRVVDVTGHDHGTPVVEGMGERGRRLDPAKPVALQSRLGEERRRPPERVHGTAHVVDEARERQLGGARSAADLRGALQHGHRAARPRKRDRGREPVRAGSDDHGVDRGFGHVRSRIGWTNSPTSERAHHAPVSRRSRHDVKR